MKLTATNIYDLRTALKLTQAQFGERVGVSWMTILRWENGKSAPASEAHKRALQEIADEAGWPKD